MKEWPKDGSPVDFAELADPIRNAIDFAYDLKRINEEEPILWEGLDISKHEKITTPAPNWSLSLEGLKYNQDQARSALTAIITIAVQLGIEQGRRLIKQEIALDLKTIFDLGRIQNSSIKNLSEKYS